MNFIFSFAAAPAPMWLQIMQAFLAPAIALGAALIAFGQWRIAQRQWETAHQKVMIDLYERRLAVLEMTEEAILNVGRTANVDADTMRLLFQARSKARFLFGADVTSFLDTAFDNISWRFVFTDDVIKGNSKNYNKLIEEKYERLKNLLGMRDRCEGLFAPYMKFDRKIAPLKDERRLAGVSDHC